MANTFTKNQPVTLIQDADSRGEIRVVDLTVYSCGKKQMILVNAAGEKFEGRNFLPQIDQMGGMVGGAIRCKVFPQMTAEQAEVEALSMAALIIAEEHARFQRAIANAEARKFEFWQGYCDAMRQQDAKIHEPRVVRG